MRTDKPDKIGHRVASIRGSVGQDAFATQMGVHKNTLARYERGERIPDADFLAKLADIGINVHWVVTGEGPARKGEDAAPDADTGVEFALVPQYDVEASAGHGAVVERESEIGKLAFRRDWLRQKGLSAKDLVVIRVTGDSMTPTIRPGSLLLVDTRQEQVKEDGIYVIMIDGHLIAKRLQLDIAGGGLFIRSDNPAYREQHLTADQASHLYIIGRGIWAGGDI